jgi:hypothetical protein
MRAYRALFDSARARMLRYLTLFRYLHHALIFASGSTQAGNLHSFVFV